MTKRELLQLLALSMLGGCAGVFDEWGEVGTMKSGQRIVVIGAGLAGLAAARELKKAGHQVLVLEARERIGGRIWTSDRWPDLPLDLGASWIHGPIGNPLSELADEVNATRLVTSYDRAMVYNTGGKILTDDEEARLERVRNRVFETLRKAQDADADTSIRQALASLADQFAGDLEALRFLNFCLSSELEQEYAGSADRLSAHWYDSAREFDGDDVLFAQGFKVITGLLAQGLDIRLAQVVREIHWQGPEMRVVTLADEFVADRVVVTLPLGVLQHGDVDFVPALPDEKAAAIGKLGMGVLNKCYLRFDRAFWPDDVDWLEYIPAQHGEWTEWVSFSRAAEWPVLLGFNAADRGREIEAWSDERIIASAMSTLKTMFGSDIASPVGYLITRWASDPFARGSYSFNALGSTPAMRSALARPVDGRLFFAGEACSREDFGTAHGAYLSGLRAARDVLSS